MVTWVKSSTFIVFKNSTTRAIIANKFFFVRGKYPKMASAKPAGKPASTKPIKTKPEKVETVEQSKVIYSKPHKRHGRLYAKAVFTGYKRGLRNQHENQVILKIEGARRKEHAQFYVGKRCVYVYRAKTLACAPQKIHRKSKVRAIWGKITRLHGNSGSVRARFRTNLPGQAMGKLVRIMLYPSKI